MTTTKHLEFSDVTINIYWIPVSHYFISVDCISYITTQLIMMYISVQVGTFVLIILVRTKSKTIDRHQCIINCRLKNIRCLNNSWSWCMVLLFTISHTKVFNMFPSMLCLDRFVFKKKIIVHAFWDLDLNRI